MSTTRLAMTYTNVANSTPATTTGRSREPMAL